MPKICFKGFVVNRFTIQTVSLGESFSKVFIKAIRTKLCENFNTHVQTPEPSTVKLKEALVQHQKHRDKNRAYDLRQQEINKIILASSLCLSPTEVTLHLRTGK